MRSFVLVHGSYHGGWCWRKVRPKLRARDHDVYTPTLTGLGERDHLVQPRAGLDLHVHDIVQVLEYEDLEDVVLVGHSYGGMVITGVAERCWNRIAHLVYLDGYLPEHGQSAVDISPSSGRWAGTTGEDVVSWLRSPPDPVEAYGISDADDVAWLRENMVPTPVWTHQEPLDAPEERAASVPRTYVSCKQYDHFDHMARKAQEDGLDFHELDTGHDAMVSAPDEVASLLLTVGGTDD